MQADLALLLEGDAVTRPILLHELS